MSKHTTSRAASQVEPTVYLLHFDAPLGNDQHRASHYCGFTTNLENRLRLHMTGQSKVPIMRALYKAGLFFQLARTWKPGSRELERTIKDTHNLSRYCPICIQEKIIRKMHIYPTPLNVVLSQLTLEDVARVPAR